MKLKRISAQKIKIFSKTKKIIVYGYNNAFSSLCDKYNIEEYVEYIIDNNPHIWNKKKKVKNRELLVYSPDCIKELSNKDYVVIIVAPYFEQLFEHLHVINNKLPIYYIRIDEDKLALRFEHLFVKNKTKNIILFRSGKDNLTAFDFDDNAKVFYEYLLKKGYNNKFKMVWVVKNPDDYIQLKNIKNVDVVSYEWEYSKNIIKAIKYAYYIHYAKYCFFTDSCYWMRNHSKNQILVSLWHGCGFKDRHAKTEPTGVHYNYMTVNSPMYAKIHAEEYGCKLNQMLITGLPKQDLLFSPIQRSYFEKFGVTDKDKIVFWLPTFRQAVSGEAFDTSSFYTETGMELIDTAEKVLELDKFLEEKNIFLFIKLHPTQKREAVSIPKCKRIILIEVSLLKKDNLHINCLLTQADALISDYSSVAVDYMLLNRPIAFVLCDLREYKESRGFVFDNIHEYLPGEELYDYRDLTKFLNDVSKKIDSTKEKRNKLLPLMHLYYDGNSCERIEKNLELNREME